MKSRMERNPKNRSFFKKNIGKVFTSGFILVFLLFLFFVFSLRGIITVYGLRSKEQNLKNEIALLKKRNKKVGKQIYELKHNKQYIASLAREKLNMIKKGELVFKFIHNAPKTENTPSAVIKSNKSKKR